MSDCNPAIGNREVIDIRKATKEREVEMVLQSLTQGSTYSFSIFGADAPQPSVIVI